MDIKTLTEQSIMKVLTANLGRNYFSYQLAANLKLKTRDVTASLKKLFGLSLIRQSSNGNQKFYYIPTPAMIEKEDRLSYRAEFVPMVGYSEKLRNIAKSAEAGR